MMWKTNELMLWVTSIWKHRIFNARKMKNWQNCNLWIRNRIESLSKNKGSCKYRYHSLAKTLPMSTNALIRMAYPVHSLNRLVHLNWNGLIWQFDIRQNVLFIDHWNVYHVQKAVTLDEPKDKPKAKKASKSKYEELPEIPDYERPKLEVYEEADFDPNKKEKVKLMKSWLYSLSLKRLFLSRYQATF